MATTERERGRWPEATGRLAVIAERMLPLIPKDILADSPMKLSQEKRAGLRSEAACSCHQNRFFPAVALRFGVGGRRV